MISSQRKHWKHITNSEGRTSLLVPLALSEDYDGCFGNTEEAMRVVENIIEERTYLSVEDIRTARADKERQMIPFSTVDYIVKELAANAPELTWANDIRPYVFLRAERVHHRERLLARGASAVFAVAQELGIPEVVVTHGAVAEPYGPDEMWAATEWQTTKVKMTPKMKEKALVVTHTSTKSDEFRSWYDKNVGAFLLPEDAWVEPDEPLYAQHLLHVDDKRTALKSWARDLPLHAIHYLSEHDDEVRQTQIKGKLPRGVPVARGMAKVAELLADMHTNLTRQ